VHSFTVGAVVFCDDVRKEVSNKEIIIGAYGGGIVVPMFPVTIPLAVWMEITPKKLGHSELDIRLKFPGNPTEFRMRVVLEAPNTTDTTTFFTPTLQAFVGEAGNIELSVKDTESEEWTVIKAKRILQGSAVVAQPMQFIQGPPEEPTASPPTASPQPSEQSPAAAPTTRPSRVRRLPLSRRTGQTPAKE
jgi:hypothetical protein